MDEANYNNSQYRLSSANTYQFKCYNEDYLVESTEADYLQSFNITPSSNLLTRRNGEIEGIPEQTIKTKTYTSSKNLNCGSVHKLWAMLQLDAADRSKITDLVTGIDFVIVIDHSASMKLNNKLAFVQATIEYLINKLNDHHRFCLIKFNQEVSLVTNGLLSMNDENKDRVRSLLHDIKPQGTTNISDALFTALGILGGRLENEQSRISSIMLFTDGLSNAGLRGKTFMDTLKELNIPVGLTINTFGYGVDHDSKMLQNISFSSRGGVYYYVESVKSIAATFGECLAGILSTVAHNIEIKLEAQDGCRIVNFYTKFPIKEVKSVKEYIISIGSMYSQESRSILFKLSLRKMDHSISNQGLVNVYISYTNTLTGTVKQEQVMMSIGRPELAREEPIPIELDKQINRYTAAAAIEEAIKKAQTKDYNGAQKQLQEVIEIVQNSPSAKDPSSRSYCEDLMEDLKECAVGMEDNESFSMGIHYAHAYSTMYFLERSTGSANLKGVRKASLLEMGTSLVEPDHQIKKRRSQGYGYITYAQEEEATLAQHQTKLFVTAYLDSVL